MTNAAAPKVPANLAALAVALAKSGATPTRHTLGRICFRLTGKSLAQSGPRRFAAAVKRARKSGTLAAAVALAVGGAA